MRNMFVESPKRSAAALKLLNVIKGTRLTTDKMPALFAMSKTEEMPIRLQVAAADQYIEVDSRNHRVIGGKNRVRLMRSG